MDLSDVYFDAFFINGKTTSTIRVKKGEVLTFQLVNDTMMHHPIHLHGHFFRLINGQGERSPLKHTVDVPPMGKRTIEFEANDAGDWFFHCHLLYHMEAGMARVITYNQDESYKPGLDPALLNPYYWMAMGYVQNNMTMGMAKIMNNRNDFGIAWDIGLEHHSDNDHSHPFEIDATWSRYFNPNFSTLFGGRFTNEDDTGSEWQTVIGAEYILMRNLGAVTSYDSEHGFGAGFSFRF